MNVPVCAKPSSIDTPLGAAATVALSAACFGAMAVFVRTAYARGCRHARRAAGALCNGFAGAVAAVVVAGRAAASAQAGSGPGADRGGLHTAVAGGTAAVGTAALDWRGVVLGVAAACIYALYLLGGSRAMRGVAPLAATTVALSSAAVLVVCLTAVRAAPGHLPQLAPTALGWSALGAVALVSTVLAMVLLFAGLARLGASRTALISTLEPVVTVLAAWFLLGEHLGLAQLAGGALVLGGALLLATERSLPATAGKAPYVQKA